MWRTIHRAGPRFISAFRVARIIPSVIGSGCLCGIRSDFLPACPKHAGANIGATTYLTHMDLCSQSAAPISASKRRIWQSKLVKIHPPLPDADHQTIFSNIYSATSAALIEPNSSRSESHHKHSVGLRVSRISRDSPVFLGLSKIQREAFWYVLCVFIRILIRPRPSTLQ